MALEVGSILQGKVKGIKKFGAFVELETGETGMVHISEVSNGFVDEIEKHLTDGQQVKVKVLSVSPDGKIALSIKKAEPKPAPKPQRGDSGYVWQPKQKQANDNMSFEDMMAKFKTNSEEKMSDIKRNTDARRGGGGYSRRGGRP